MMVYFLYRLYMFDGFYQSVMAFFIPYLVFYNTAVVSQNGLDVSERFRFGFYALHPTIITINLYILINTYRWDWLMLLVVVLSDLFVFFWTGVYTSTTYSGFLYKAAPQVYGELTFWLVLIITPVVCLFPRFAIKALQKVYFPYDVDIIREQITLGRFKGVTGGQGGDESPGADSSESPEPPQRRTHAAYPSVDEDRRPIYPPSVATHNTRTQNGSDGSNYTFPNRQSMDAIADIPDMPVRPSIDRARPSYDRVRASMDRVRASFEQSNDFTSAARLSRIESSHSTGDQPNQRRFNLNTVRRRGLSAFSKKSINEP